MTLITLSIPLDMQYGADSERQKAIDSTEPSCVQSRPPGVPVRYELKNTPPYKSPETQRSLVGCKAKTLIAA
jgi:hypothetical protein